MSDSSSAILEENTVPVIQEPVPAPQEVAPQEPVPVPQEVAPQEPVPVTQEVAPQESVPATQETIPIQTFTDIVKNLIESELMNEKNKIKLTPEAKNIINNLLTLSPNTLNDIEKSIIDIVKDDKIDSNDIPNLIVVIQRIYQFIYSLKTVKFDYKKRAEITSISLKYLIHVLVLLDKVNVSEDKKESFLIQTDVLVDSCVGLLSFSKNIKTPGCFRKK